MFASSSHALGGDETARPTSAGARRLRARIWIAYGAMGVLLVGYFAYLLLGDQRDATLIDGWMVDGFELVLSMLCLCRVLVRRAGRVTALALGLGILSWSLGDLALTVESLGNAKPPVPSVADGFYLGFFPMAYVAVVAFMRGDTRQLASPSWLDGVVAGLGAAAVCAAFAFHHLVRLTGGNSLQVATNLAYPVGDLLLLFLVVAGTAMLSGRRKAPWLLLASGAAINVAGDTFNLFGSAAGASAVGTVVDAGAWPTSILLMSMAVWLKPGCSSPFAPAKPTGFLLPGLASSAALAILVYGSLHHTGRVAIGLAAATLVAAGTRVAGSARGLRRLNRKRYRQSLTDDLTGLENRRYLFNVLDAYFAEEAGAPERSLAFLFIDLNQFKELNDSFGHPAGDEILRQLSARLKETLRECDALIRLGGDEFAVLLMGVDGDFATTTAQRITAGLQEPFELEGVSPRISASIGIAIAPHDAGDAAGLVRCADIAMYRAKSRGEPFALYGHEEDFDAGGNRLRLAEELRTAVQSGQLVLHYQPQLELGSQRVAAFEALVRWAHPRLGLVPPLRFLMVAEEAGLMGALTRWVLDQAIGQCAAWRLAGQELAISINVSASNLLEPGFAKLVAGLLKRHGVPAEALVLEITETSVIAEFERSSRVIRSLDEEGVSVSVDDFGAGFTSLAHLGGLAITELKLDRTFIKGLADPDDGRRRSLLRVMIDLGHALGLRVVAEGVEDERTLALLGELGCDLAQGYLIAVPKPACELTLPCAPTSAAARTHTRAPARADPRALRVPSAAPAR